LPPPRRLARKGRQNIQCRAILNRKPGSRIWGYDFEEKQRVMLEVAALRKRWERQMVEVNG